MGRVVRVVFMLRKTCSTIHSCLYCRATPLADKSVVVVSTHLPSYLASSLIFVSSISKAAPALLRYFLYPLFPTRLLSPCLSLFRNAAIMASRSPASFFAWSSLTHTMYLFFPTMISFTFNGEGALLCVPLG